MSLMDTPKNERQSRGPSQSLRYSDGASDSRSRPSCKKLRLQEYISLRAELLQRYNEQSQLAFASTLATAAFFFQTVASKPGIVSNLLASILLQLVMIIISGRLTWNYQHIFRIGSYLRVVHEDYGGRRIHGTKSLDKVWWIGSSREIMTGKTNKRVWGRHAVSEAWLMVVLGLFGPFSVTATLMTSDNSFSGINSFRQVAALMILISVLIATSLRLVVSAISLSKSAANPNAFGDSIRGRIEELHPKES